MAPQAETTEQATFYTPWPLFGRRFSSQLDESRHNSEALHPLVRAAGLDGLSSPLKDHAVQSWEVGEDGFHNKYRLFWDKDNDTFRIQENIGTTDVPSWDDRLTIGSSGELVGNFYVDATGGSGVSDHGALTGLSDDDHPQYLLASAATSRAAFAANWTDLTDGGSTTLHTHDHGGLGGLSDDDHPQYLLRTDENGFYGSVVKMSDGSKSFRGITVIAVDKDHFYLEQNAGNTDEVVISLKPPAGSGGVTDHGALTGLSDDDHPQYLLRTDENGFYGITIKQSNDASKYRGINVVGFDSEYFYLQQNNTNTDEVVISLKPPPSSGSAVDHGSLAGLSDDDHGQYALTDGSRDITGHQDFLDDIRVANKVVAEAFYTGFVNIWDEGGGLGGHIESRFGLRLEADNAIVLDAGTSVSVAALSDISITTTGAGSSVYIATDGDEVVLSSDNDGGSHTLVIKDNSVFTRSGASARFSGFYLDGQRGEVYAYDFNRNHFYVEESTQRKGRYTVNLATDPGQGGGSGVTDHGALTGLADDDHTQYFHIDGRRRADKVKSGGFYLTEGVNGIGHDLGQQDIQFDVPNVDVTSYFLDSFVSQGYMVNDFKLACSDGSATVGFYILSPTEMKPRGIGIVGFGNNSYENNLGDFYVVTRMRRIAAQSNNIMRENDSLVMSVFENSTCSHLRGRINIRFVG